jgi:hypothetical protein
MRESTIPLTQMPSRDDFEAVRARAHDECECTEEMRLVFKETGVSCKSCAARHTLNGIATLSESL